MSFYETKKEKSANLFSSSSGFTQVCSNFVLSPKHPLCEKACTSLTLQLMAKTASIPTVD